MLEVFLSLFRIGEGERSDIILSENPGPGEYLRKYLVITSLQENMVLELQLPQSMKIEDKLQLQVRENTTS